MADDVAAGQGSTSLGSLRPSHGLERFAREASRRPRPGGRGDAAPLSEPLPEAGLGAEGAVWRPEAPNDKPGVAPRYETLIEALSAGARADRPEAGLIFFDHDHGADGSRRLGFAEVLDTSLRYGAALQRAGVERREPVVLLLPTSPETLHVLLGLMALGAVSSALAPPSGFGQGGELAGAPGRIARIARYLGARRVVTTRSLAAELATSTPDLEAIAAEDLDAAARDAGAVLPAPLTGDDLAFIQCTSGSTGEPKGVLISQANLTSNVHASGLALGVTPRDALTGWLPLYHDMGLIGCVCMPIYWGIRGILLSPRRFLRRPVSWLQAISRHRGTISPAPNFAYAHATLRIRDEELSGLDLSSWRTALCGAEPLHAPSLLRFQARFSRVGLPEGAITPCYGLAEATLAVSFHPPGTPLQVDHVNREALSRGEVVDAPHDAPDALAVVSSGRPAPGTEVRILDDDGRVVGPGRVGRVVVRSPSVMAGYHALPEETVSALRDGWLDTGDLGYLRDGALRITDRRKDMVILRGRNYAPSDFEWAAEEVSGVRKGKVVAFGVHDPDQGTEALYVLCETDVLRPGDRGALAAAIRSHIAERTGVSPAIVDLLPRGAVPKTSSGKLQRRQLKADYLASRSPSPRDLAPGSP